MAPAEPFRIGGEQVPPGSRRTIELDLPRLYTHAPMTLPVHVVRGFRDGPRLFVCAAIHGDELNGIEVVRRLLRRRALHTMRGTLVAVPVVNVYGVLQHSRYLPDGRDLNRCFPGSEGGSTAARIADLFMHEVVSRCSHGIDLHAGSGHRCNLPQVRANLDDAETLRLAQAFDVPVVINARIRDGSLRAAAGELGVPLLIYETGERLRFDEIGIRAGVRGVLGVMHALGMIRLGRRGSRQAPFVARSTRWVRAPASGVLRVDRPLGAYVGRGERLATVADPFGDDAEPVLAPDDGVIVGCTRIPLVHEGDALFHLARFDDAEEVAGVWEAFQEDHLLHGADT